MKNMVRKKMNDNKSIIKRLKEFFKGEKEVDDSTKFIPYISNKKIAYTRGIDDIVFTVDDYDKEKLIAVDILVYQQAHHAFTHIFYSVRGQDLRQTIEDGFYNADNGRVTMDIDALNKLQLSWELGDGVALGDYNVTMITISKNDTKIAKDKITIWQKSGEGFDTTTVRTA
jgi:hypothetical protein